MYQLCFSFSLALMAVINRPANRLLAQIGAKNRATETRACFTVEFFFPPFSIIKFRIIMSFRKPCHMPLHKFIPSFTLTVHGFNQSRIEKASKDFIGVTDTFWRQSKTTEKENITIWSIVELFWNNSWYVSGLSVCLVSIFVALCVQYVRCRVMGQ